MTRTENKIEMSIIDKMIDDPCSGEIKFLKRIYREKPPEKSRNVDDIMDALILVVHERNRLEKLKKRDKYELELLAFANGEINALCYVLGLNTRL